MSKNIILTASDENFFDSFIKLVLSLKKTEIYKILLLDIGLNDNNKNFIKKIEIVSLISFEKEFSELDREIGCEYFKNKNTYGFKPYLLKNFYKNISLEDGVTYNILYVDSGIYANKPFNDIFDIIEKEDIFCIDHNSEMDYGNIEKKRNLKLNYGGCMLSNILPPLIYEKLNKKVPINLAGLTKQYIKAGFFGYKFKGKYQKIIDDNLKLFKNTLIGIFPVSENSEINHLLKDVYLFQNIKEKYYENLLNEYLNENKYIKFFSTKYSTHRFDQTILSYLINANEITHKDSDKYITTSYQKTHFIKYIYFHALFLLKRKDEIEDLIDIDYENDYNLSDMNISENLNLYFSQQYVNIFCEKYNMKRKYFSEDDILYDKYNYILKIHDIKIDVFTDKLYYNLMINWCNQKNNTHKKILLKTDKKYALLHRNNIIKKSGQIINLIKKEDKKLFIMGNGPSLKEIMNNKEYLNFLRKNTTFGLNAAYRAYEKYNFYPNFFGCFDSKVCKYHSKEFENLILDSPIQKFFFINRDVNGDKIFTDPKIINHEKFVDINFILRKNEEKKLINILSYNYSYFVDMLTSGTNAVQCGLIEGYKEIYLLGCDCNYVEIIEGADLKKNSLIMRETPKKNINYWIDDYQQKGDIFNLPNVQGCQLPAWKRLNDTLNHLKIKVKIFNCSNISKIDYFEKIDFSHLYLANTLDK